MSHKSRRTITSMVAGAVLVAGYIVYAWSVAGSANSHTRSLGSWALAILVFIGASVVALIIIQVLFHVAASVGIAARERDADGAQVNRILASSMVEDERDELIDLRAARIGYVCVGVGFVVTLAAVALGASGTVALHLLLGAFIVAAMVGGARTVFLHESGVQHG